MSTYSFHFEKLEERIAPTTLSSMLSGSLSAGVTTTPLCNDGSAGVDLSIHVKAQVAASGCVPAIPCINPCGVNDVLHTAKGLLRCVGDKVC